MGLHPRNPSDAGAGARPPRAPRRRAARAGRGRRLAAGLIALPAALLAAPGAAEPIPAPVPGAVRVAAWNADLGRDGPGLLLRGLLDGDDAGAEAVLAGLAAARPDVLLLTEIDWDGDGAALAALADLLAARGLRYPHRLLLPSNAGLATGLDLDGDGRRGTARDAQGYGRFAGHGAMAVLSRLPLGEPVDLSALLWRDLPGARLPAYPDGAPFPSEAARAAQRLSSAGHWIVPVEGPAPFALLAWDATPPVFDGPEDRNGLRNADELALWLRLLDGDLATPPPAGPFVLLGQANLDPRDGEGLTADMAALLADPRLRDPRPASAGARLLNEGWHGGDGALDTAGWDGGGLRATYVLPSAHWRALAAGTLWPAPGEPLADALAPAGPHHLVWADIAP